MAVNETPPKLIIPGLAGLYSLSEWGYPLVRFVAGAFFMPHGAQKLFGGNISAVADSFAQLGLEPALLLAYLAGVTEFFGGLLVAIGLLTRPAAAATAILLLVALIEVHLAHGYFWTSGGFEYPLMWLLIMVSIFFRGGGRHSVDRAIGREF